MQLFQRLKDFHASFFTGLEPRYDPRCWDSAMYSLYPDADRPASSRRHSYEESAMTRLNYPVPL
jgi:hypothetical protein